MTNALLSTLGGKSHLIRTIARKVAQDDVALAIKLKKGWVNYNGLVIIHTGTEDDDDSYRVELQRNGRTLEVYEKAVAGAIFGIIEKETGAFLPVPRRLRAA